MAASVVIIAGTPGARAGTGDAHFGSCRT